MSGASYWVRWRRKGQKWSILHRANHDGSGMTWCRATIPHSRHTETEHWYEEEDILGADLCAKCEGVA